MTEYDILSDGSAMAAVSDEPTDEEQLPVHGVLFGTNDITSGLSGKRTRWPPGVLESMAEEGVFDGKPLTLADSLDPEQHVGVEMTEDGPVLTGAVSMDEKVGEIRSTAFDPDIGLLFEGFIADWEAEDAVTSGLAQISPVVMREIELAEGDGEDDPDALFEVTDVSGARDVALVADGAVPSNKIRVGENPELGESGVAEALSAHYDIPLEALTASDGAGGGNGAGGSDDGPSGGTDQSTPGQDADNSDWRSSMTHDDLTDKEREILAAAGQQDDPRVVEAEVLAELEALQDDYGELLDEATDLDDPQVVESSTLEAMNQRLKTVEGMFDEALVEERGLRESTVEAMSFEAKVSEFETDDGELDIEALTQTPETGTSPTSGASSGDGGDSEVSAEDRARIAAIEEKFSVMGSSLPPARVEALQAEATKLADAEDYEAALEVL